MRFGRRGFVFASGLPTKGQDGIGGLAILEYVVVANVSSAPCHIAGSPQLRAYSLRGQRRFPGQSFPPARPHDGGLIVALLPRPARPDDGSALAEFVVTDMGANGLPCGSRKYEAFGRLSLRLVGMRAIFVHLELHRRLSRRPGSCNGGVDPPPVEPVEYS
jgi:hypothetical protein